MSFIKLIQLKFVSRGISHVVALSCWTGHMMIKNVSTFFTCHVVIVSNVSPKRLFVCKKQLGVLFKFQNIEISIS